MFATLRAVCTELPAAARRLSRARGFSFTVVAFLGSAVAALLAIAATAYGIWLRPLPFPDADRLVDIRGYSRAMTFSLGLSAPLIAELQETYPHIEAYGPWQQRRVEEGLRPIAIAPGAMVALGAQPAFGRSFDAANPDADADTALISDALWQSRWSRDPGVLGRTIAYAGRERRIIGVMAPSFRFPDASANLWLSLLLTPADMAPENAQVFGGLEIIARLDPEGSAAAFTAAMQSRFGKDERIAGIREHMKIAFEAEPLRRSLAGTKADIVALLAAAVAIVLATTLANVANLWLTRALARQRELALASALGATTARAAASVFAEVLLLTLSGCLAGLALAPGVLAALQWAGVVDASAALVVDIDAVSAALAVVVALAVSTMLALPAWWLVRRVSGAEALRQGPTVVSERPAVARLRRGLIAVQIALAVALLGAGGLMLRSLASVLQQETGFAREGTLLATVQPRTAMDELYGRMPTDAEIAAVRAFYARVRELPGLTASFATAVPFSGSESVATFIPPGASSDEESAAKTRSVGPDYFAALGIPIVAGRDIDPENSENEVVVDQVFAARYLAGGDPLGQQLGFNEGPGKPPSHATVVGVARNVKQATLEEQDEQGTFYFLRRQPNDSGIQLVVRSALPLADVRAMIEREAAAGGLGVSRIATIDALVWQSLRDRSALLGMLGAFAVFGTALAVLGLYAALAFATRRRTAEFGLKLALGAPPARLAGDVVRDAWRIVLPGFVLAVPAAYAAVRAIESRLYGVQALDAPTWLAVFGVVALLVLLSAALPARRAASVDPMRTLRQD